MEVKTTKSYCIEPGEFPNVLGDSLNYYNTREATDQSERSSGLVSSPRGGLQL